MRPAKLYEWNGWRYSLTDWAEISGVPRYTITDRIKAGWTFEQAIVYLPGDAPPGRGRGRHGPQQARAA